MARRKPAATQQLEPIPFLEVLTRTFGQRPMCLSRCRESLDLLRDPDWVQRLIVDDGARGVAWANRNLSTVEARGRWVWLLDDDDLCSDAELIAHLRGVVAAEKPDVVAVRVYHGRWGMLPPCDLWGQGPVHGKIGPSNVIVRQEVWNRYRDAWPADYAGDYHFISALWGGGLRWSYLPIIAAYQPAQNYGKPEACRAS